MSVAVLSTLSVQEPSTSNSESKSPDAISLSALLKASQRLSSMTDITGNICVIKGRLFVLVPPSEIVVPQSLMQSVEKVQQEKEEEKKARWRQEGATAELVVSLNMVLDMYVLQVHVQDKVAATDALHMGRRDTKTKYCFYIDYDLRFRYINAAELGLSGSPVSKSGSGPGADLPMFPEIAKNIKNFAFHWKHTIDPDLDYADPVLLCSHKR